MKLNTTSQYAIRIMIFIVKNGKEKLHNAKNISQQLTIPYKYLTRIMTQLVDAGFIISIRGREGGYSIAKQPSTIAISDILEAVKECLHGDDCLLGLGACNIHKKCALHDQWILPRNTIIDVFKNTYLSDINKINFNNLNNN